MCVGTEPAEPVFSETPIGGGAPAVLFRGSIPSPTFYPAVLSTRGGGLKFLLCLPLLLPFLFHVLRGLSWLPSCVTACLISSDARSCTGLLTAVPACLPHPFSFRLSGFTFSVHHR